METHRSVLQDSSSNMKSELTVEQYLTQQCDILIKVCQLLLSRNHDLVSRLKSQCLNWIICDRITGFPEAYRWFDYKAEGGIYGGCRFDQGAHDFEFIRLGWSTAKIAKLIVRMIHNLLYIFILMSPMVDQLTNRLCRKYEDALCRPQMYRGCPYWSALQTWAKLGIAYLVLESSLEIFILHHFVYCLPSRSQQIELNALYFHLFFFRTTIIAGRRGCV